MPESRPSPVRAARRIVATAGWAEPALIVLFTLLTRLPTLSRSVIDWDESVYMLAARALAHGQLPYVAVFDDKPLGAPVLMASAMAIGGHSVEAVRLLGCLAVAATALLLRRLLRTIGLPRSSGLAGALLYVAFTTRLGGLPTNTEILLAPFTAAALCVAASGRDAVGWRRQTRTIAAMGLLFGLAIWIKYVPALPASVAFATVMALAWRRARVTPCAIAWLASVYTLACALPTGLSAALYLASGHFSEFWYCNFGFMRAYHGMPAQWPRYVALQSAIGLWPLVPLSAAAILSGAWNRNPAQPRWPIAGLALWLAVEALAVVIPGHFFAHSFLLLVPPLAALAGAALGGIAERTVLPRFRAMAPGVLAAAIALVPLALDVGENPWDWLPGGTPPDDVPRLVAKRLADEPGASAWVVNYQPIVYFLADIPPPTRFPFPPHLTGDEAALTGIDPLPEVERILAARPRFLVVDETKWSDVTPRTAAPIHAALARDYTKVAAFTVFRSATPEAASVSLYRLTAAEGSPGDPSPRLGKLVQGTGGRPAAFQHTRAIGS